MSLPQLKPSPVHESSLRQALQRVEDRLRQQDQKRRKAQRQERTLKLARELAVEGIRQRQKNWQRDHSNTAPGRNRKASSRIERTDSRPSGVAQAVAAAKTEETVDTPPRPGRQTPKRRSSHGLTRLMPMVAWLILAAGLVGAVLSWTTIGHVQADSLAIGGARPDALPLGLLLGFAYLATGVLGFAFFWVSSLIYNQIRDIRRLLLHPPVNEKSRR